MLRSEMNPTQRPQYHTPITQSRSGTEVAEKSLERATELSVCRYQ